MHPIPVPCHVARPRKPPAPAPRNRCRRDQFRPVLCRAARRDVVHLLTATLSEQAKATLPDKGKPPALGCFRHLPSGRGRVHHHEQPASACRPAAVFGDHWLATKASQIDQTLQGCLDQIEEVGIAPAWLALPAASPAGPLIFNEQNEPAAPRLAEPEPASQRHRGTYEEDCHTFNGRA
jgi:hypothetical protein